MLFSYGFIEETVTSAKTIFLALDIPDDDPLAPAKKAVNTSPPGVRLTVNKNSDFEWESDYVWLICVNEEDGLNFNFAMTVDGQKELKVFWHEAELLDTASLRNLLQQEALWDVYSLRAVSIVQDKVAVQLQSLKETETTVARISNANCRNFVSSNAARLRLLEAELLEVAFSKLEEEVRLLTSVRQQSLNKSVEIPTCDL